jgi:hypothetical protein
MVLARFSGKNPQGFQYAVHVYFYVFHWFVFNRIYVALMSLFIKCKSEKYSKWLREIVGTMG